MHPGDPFVKASLREFGETIFAEMSALAARTGAINLGHGKTGFLVAESDLEGFAERIASLLEDEVLASELSAAALAWSWRFDWDRAADEMAAALEGALQPS